jgi:putative ABC transport system permease protein
MGVYVGLLFDELRQNLRYGWRMLAKNPAFTLVAAFTLALGIGANTAAFSILNGVLLRPLPYEDPARLVVIWDQLTHSKSDAPIFASYPDFEQLQRYAHSFSNISAATWAVNGRVWTNHGSATRLMAVPVTQTFFDTLGVKAAIGRTFRAGDESAACVVVLSDGFWKTALGAPANIVGRDLTLNEVACTVAGVMPERFSFYPRQTQLWILAGSNFRPRRADLIVGIFARLKPGVTITAARTETGSLHNALHVADSRERNTRPLVLNLQDQFTFLAGRTLRSTVWLITAAVAFVLLIACLNVANLLLGRSGLREREFAVRAALGSGKRRLVRQLLTESLLLASLSSIGGIALAYGVLRYFVHANPIELPAGSEIKIDLTVLLFSGILTVGTTVVFGLLPALRGSRVDLSQALKAAGRGTIQQFTRQRLARAIVALELALSLALLTGAGLFLSSLLRMRDAQLGFDPHGLSFVSVDFTTERYAAEEKRAMFCARLWRKLEILLPASSFAFGSKSPLYGGGNDAIEIEGKASPSLDQTGDAGVESVSPRFFQVLKTPLLSGREFSYEDRAGAPQVAIVNESLARQYFPNQSPLGARIRFREGNRPGPWLTVVGVTANTKHSELMREMSWIATPTAFRPIFQSPALNGPGNSLFVFTRTRDNSVPRAIQKAIAGLDNQVPVGDVETMEASISMLLSFARFRAVLVSAFASTAVVLAIIGLHGVLTQLVTQRISEFGIRMALGASARDLVFSVAACAGTPLLTGLGIGLAISLAVGRVMGGLLYEVEPTDPGILTGAAFLLCCTAAVALVVPASQASHVDPAVALRNE